MSWFLKKKKIILVFLLCGAIILLFTRLWAFSLLIIWAIGVFVLNKIVLKKSNKMPLLSAQRKIKKYKYLVIGDLCSYSVLKDFIDNQDDAFTILAPGRSLDASYQILLHTISILDEDGVCIIIDSGKHSNQVYTVFDVPYLNLVTRKELQIESLFRKASYPLFYEPVKSLFILFNLTFGNYKFRNVICTDKRFANFFQQRSNRFIYFKLKN